MLASRVAKRRGEGANWYAASEAGDTTRTMNRLTSHPLVAGAAAALLGLALAGCQLFPGAGLSREQAIETARGHAGLANPVLVDAEFMESSAIEWHGPAREGAIWVVRFRGITEICPPPAAPGFPPNRCVDQAAESTVYLDSETGEFISTGTSPLGP